MDPRRRISWFVTVLLLAGLLTLPAARTAAQGYVTQLNPSGGTNLTDGLRVSFKPNGRVDVVRNNTNQLWIGSMLYALFIDGANGPVCVTLPSVLCAPASTSTLQQHWTPTALAVDDQQAQIIFTYDYSGVGVFTLTTDWHYVSPNQYIDVRVRVDVPEGYAGPLQLYAFADVALDGDDYGPGVMDYWQGRRVVAQTNETTAVSGIREARTPWDSYVEGYFNCVFGFPADCPNPALGWTAPNRGIGHGETYPNTVDPATDSDASVGAHWDLSDDYSRVVTMQWYYSSYEDFIAGNTEDINPDEVSPWPEDQVVPTPTPQPQATPVPDCTTLPDMAVSPELINLAAGGSAQIEVALRNLCADRVFRGADLLVSLSDGITVRDGSAGMLNLGGRAAWQNLSLNPGETRRFLVNVSAPGAVPAAPQHITELYYAGAVARRIDGVFISAAPVSAPAAPADVQAAAPTAPAAPLPSVLPNTVAGRGQAPLLPAALALAVLALATVRFAVRRSRRTNDR